MAWVRERETHLLLIASWTAQCPVVVKTPREVAVVMLAHECFAVLCGSPVGHLTFSFIL